MLTHTACPAIRFEEVCEALACVYTFTLRWFTNALFNIVHGANPVSVACLPTYFVKGKEGENSVSSTGSSNTSKNAGRSNSTSSSHHGTNTGCECCGEGIFEPIKVSDLSELLFPIIVRPLPLEYEETPENGDLGGSNCTQVWLCKKV